MQEEGVEESVAQEVGQWLTVGDPDPEAHPVEVEVAAHAARRPTRR